MGRAAYYKHETTGDYLAIYTSDNGEAWCSVPLSYRDLAADPEDIDCESEFNDWGPWRELTDNQLAALRAE